jgi:Cu/Ag efflux pump CusA
VEGRDLAAAVNDAIQQVNGKVALPRGYRMDWGGEYTEYTASSRQLNIILPLTLFLIFLLLFLLYSNFKFPFITVLGVLLSAPVGGLLRGPAAWVEPSTTVREAARLMRRDGVSALLVRGASPGIPA